jgi:hypothetical protein
MHIRLIKQLIIEYYTTVGMKVVENFGSKLPEKKILSAKLQRSRRNRLGKMNTF